MWAALLEGRDASHRICPEGRWSEFSSASPASPSGSPRRAPAAATSRDIKGFDAEFFALSKMEADNIDPQQRMALELTWEALGARADSRHRACAAPSVGVYVGSSNNDYMFLALPTRPPRTRTPSPAPPAPIIANRVSYFYDFRGPSMIHRHRLLQSSLVAAHRGRQARCARVRPTWPSPAA